MVSLLLTPDCLPGCRGVGGELHHEGHHPNCPVASVPPAENTVHASASTRALAKLPVALGASERDVVTATTYAKAALALYGSIIFWYGTWTQLDTGFRYRWASDQSHGEHNPWCDGADLPFNPRRDACYVLVGSALLVLTDALYANAGIDGNCWAVPELLPRGAAAPCISTALARQVFGCARATAVDSATRAAFVLALTHVGGGAGQCGWWWRCWRVCCCGSGGTTWSTTTSASRSLSGASRTSASCCASSSRSRSRSAFSCPRRHSTLCPALPSHLILAMMATPVQAGLGAREQLLLAPLTGNPVRRRNSSRSPEPTLRSWARRCCGRAPTARWRPSAGSSPATTTCGGRCSTARSVAAHTLIVLIASSSALVHSSRLCTKPKL